MFKPGDLLRVKGPPRIVYNSYTFHPDHSGDGWWIKDYKRINGQTVVLCLRATLGSPPATVEPGEMRTLFVDILVDGEVRSINMHILDKVK